MSLEYTRLSGPDDLQALARILQPAFRIADEDWPRFVQKLGEEQLRVVRCAGEVVGGLGIYPAGQWFGGRRLAMGGVSVVAVRPESRRTGAAAHLMTEALRELQREGVPLSALYAATSRLYGSVGYERAGAAWTFAQPLRLIDLQDRELPLRRVEPSGPEPFEALQREHARRTNGNLDRGPALWEHLLSAHRGPLYAYLVGPEEAPEGYVIFAQPEAKPGSNQGHDLAVRDLVALTRAGARRLWTLFADHATVAGEVRWRGPPVDPLLDLLPEQDFRVADAFSWSLRLVDVPAALAGRGYTPAVEGELHLEVTDDVLPENAGRYVLTVEGGRGEVAPGGRGTLRLDVRALAPLYSGHVTPAELATGGRLEAPPEAAALATALFSGPAPWMPDGF